MKTNARRALIETVLVFFLFYSYLLMGEFTRSGMGSTMGLAWAIRDIFTVETVAIGAVLAMMASVFIELILWSRAPGTRTTVGSPPSASVRGMKPEAVRKGHAGGQRLG